MIAKNNANKKNAILYYIMLLFSFVGYIIIISFSVSLNAAIWYFTLLVVWYIWLKCFPEQDVYGLIPHFLISWAFGILHIRIP